MRGHQIRAQRVLSFLCGLMVAAGAVADTDLQKQQRPSPYAAAADADYISQFRTHRIGNIGFSLSNWGQFGNGGRIGGRDYCTGNPSISWEFPLGSGLDYLGQGGLWIGAIRGKDTIVSTGTDGWEARTEFFPRPVPDGGFSERTSRPLLKAYPPLSTTCGDVYFSEDAVSEQDLITHYYDTVESRRFIYPDPFDGREHIPVGFEVEQKTYAWSYDYAKDFILMDLGLKNLSGDVVNEMYVGIFMDFNVGHHKLMFQPQWDDISGIVQTVPSTLVPGLLDTLNIAWSADNNGDPNWVAQYTNLSPTAVAGVRLLKAPAPNLKYSFNWWASNDNVGRDWGPNKRSGTVVFTRGNLGTPLGDIARYQMMANGEIDYDQIEAAMDHQAEGWLPPVRDAILAADLADGYDTRFLLSFGPFDVAADSVLNLTLAFVAGADFHTDARNFGRYFDPARPELFYEHLNFSELIRNAQWAAWVYDTPGYDTDEDGYRGEFHMVGRDTVYYRGDGVPDFRGPPPPPAPLLRFQTSHGRVVMRWNGYKTETTLDYFSGVPDFEGYRVYMSRTGQLDAFAMLAQRDNINYVRYQYRPSWSRWTVDDRPLTLDSLQTLYDDLVDSVYNFRPFHPDSFKVRDIDFALREIVLDPYDRSRLDTNYYCFANYSNNEKVNDTAAATLADCCASDVMGVIRKRYPFATPADTIVEDGVSYPAYYEYEYAIENLYVAEPIFMAVTAFDYGDPKVGLDPLETSPQANATEIWPVNSAEVVNTSRPKPGVYPNPYRLADDYNTDGWEDRRREGLDPERARKVTFTNVPDTCVVSIWSLDGDLVKRLEHKAHPASSEATVVVWNLITRNTQAVKTGIYIYAIESRFGTDVGKLVIIK